MEMEYFGLYAETRRRGNVDGHVGSHDDDPPSCLRTGTAHRRGFYVHTIVTMSESQSPSDFRRESSRTTSLFTLSRPLGSFNIDAMARTPSEAQTPMPNIDDDLSMQRYISDRRVIGVMVFPSAHSCSYYMRSV